MNKVFILTLIGTTFIFGTLSYFSFSSLDTQALSSEAIEGKRIWQRKACVECHTLFGNGGYNAPELTRVVSRKGKEGVSTFLEERPVIRTSKGKRHIQLERNEIEKLVLFLDFVNTVEIPKWPPPPINVE